MAGSIDELDFGNVDALIDARAPPVGSKLRRPSYDVSFSSSTNGGIVPSRFIWQATVQNCELRMFYRNGNAADKSSQTSLPLIGALIGKWGSRLDVQVQALRDRPLRDFETMPARPLYGFGG
jgi:hypothetical protein